MNRKTGAARRATPVGRQDHPAARGRGRRRGRGGALLLTAAALAGAALYNRTRAQRAEHDHPPAGQFIEVEGVRLHYIDRGPAQGGRGQPIVLLHGDGAMIEDMTVSGLVDRLSERHRVIAFDRPGFGHSSRPRNRVWAPAAQAALIHEALRRLGAERAVIVGHIWGTLVALALTLAHPRDAAAIVLLSGYYFPTLRADAPLMAGPAIPIIGDIIRYTVSPPLARLTQQKILQKIFAPAPIPERFDRFPLEMALRPSQIRATAAENAMLIPAAAELSRRYAALSLPTIIMAGDGDRIVDFRRHSVRLHEMLPGSDLRILPGVGHMIHHTAPDAVAQAIEQAAQQAAAANRPAQPAAMSEPAAP